MGSYNAWAGVGVGCVLTDDEEGTFLLGERLAADRHGQGTWSFPGGKPKLGEPPEAAALRELAEETGIYADFAAPLGVWTYDRWPDINVHYVTLYFLIDHRNQEAANLEPHKHGDWEWLTPEEARDRPLFAGVEAILNLMA